MHAAPQNFSIFLALASVCLLLATTVAGLPLKKERLDDVDPLLAMPSETHHRRHHLIQLDTQSPAGHRNLVTVSQQYPEPSSGEFQAPESGGRPMAREEVYYVVDPRQQASQGDQGYQPAAPEEANQGQAGPSEYPGEIVYVGGETPNPSIGQESAGPAPESVVSHEDAAEAERPMAETKSGALPATILTEVPLRDMPSEVLDRLRREYGVKIVATRDYPGANLVLNCEDYTSDESSMCYKPDTSQNEAPSQQPRPATGDQYNSEEIFRGHPRIRADQYPASAPTYYYAEEKTPSDDERRASAEWETGEPERIAPQLPSAHVADDESSSLPENGGTTSGKEEQESYQSAGFEVQQTK